MPGTKNWIARAIRYSFPRRPRASIESAIHLIQVKVVCGCARCLPALVLASGMDGFHQLVDFVRSKEAGFAFAVRANINDADAIMGIEHGDGNYAVELRASCASGRASRVKSEWRTSGGSAKS